MGAICSVPCRGAERKGGGGAWTGRDERATSHPISEVKSNA
jgi:hypothetical protein